MQNIQPLENGAFYHIFNRGINGENIFREHTNYKHFLNLYSEYIEPVAETYSWCLLKNHFHFLVRILPEDEIDYIKLKPEENRVFKMKKKYNPSRQFSHLFNAYAKAFNKKYVRTGALFETPFRRFKVTNENYFKTLIYYIHYNPVKHGFVEEMIDYPWSSYLTLLSVNPTGLKREKVIGWFNSESEFIEFHGMKQNITNIQPFIFE
jgi:putative transposase